MNIGVALIIVIISGTVGGCTFMLVRPEVKRRSSKKYPKHICTLIGIIGLAVYISFLMCMGGEHLNSSSTYEEVPIEKLTTGRIYFADKECSLNESYAIIEEPNEKYNNVVLIETESYELQWICRIRTEGSKYHIYLSEDTYRRLQDGNVIYEREKRQ